jgi:hypothetical protein
MANTVEYLGYLHASGKNPFLRVFGVSFTGTYTQNNGEVVNLTAATNPNGVEDLQTPASATPTIQPFILDSTLNGYKPELEIGGTGTPGSYGIRFFSGGGTELAASASYLSDFPANAQLGGYGQVLIGVLDSLG